MGIDCSLEIRSPLVPSEKKCFQGYYLYASMYMNCLLFPEVVARGWQYNLVTTAATSSLAGTRLTGAPDTPMTKMCVAAVHMRRYLFEIGDTVFGKADDSHDKITSLNRYMCANMMTKATKGVYMTLDERQAVERELIQMSTRGTQYVLKQNWSRLMEDGLMQRVMELPSELPMASAPYSATTPAGRLVATLSKEYSEHLFMLRQLPGVLQLYEAVNGFASGEVPAGAALKDIKERDVVEGGVRAYNAVRGVMPPDGFALACGGVKTYFEEISRETEVAPLLTTGRDVGEMGKILGLVQVIVHRVNEVREAVAEYIKDEQGQWVGDGYEQVGQGVAWVVHHRSGVLSETYATDAETVLKMNHTGDTEDDLTTATYIVMEIAKLLPLSLSVEDLRTVTTPPTPSTTASPIDSLTTPDMPPADLTITFLQYLKELTTGSLRVLQQDLEGLAGWVGSQPDVDYMRSFVSLPFEGREDDELINSFKRSLTDKVRVGHLPLLHRTVGRVLAEKGEGNAFEGEARRRFNLLHGEVPRPRGYRETKRVVEEFAEAEEDKEEVLEVLAEGMEHLLHSDKHMEGGADKSLNDWGVDLMCDVFAMFTPDWTMQHRVAAFALLLEVQCDTHFASQHTEAAQYEE
eukprot:TRINITY_DN7026_c0_g2_i1.p1 TRINITY_DN7026_c0_g2~~TRINITY_DN7026_c0_g2_i1.p1  ORF type:complete len:685 (+),score=233.78 TRINITY_DN7026_c0_g2_i1:157-2055(+)